MQNHTNCGFDFRPMDPLRTQRVNSLFCSFGFSLLNNIFSFLSFLRRVTNCLIAQALTQFMLMGGGDKTEWFCKYRSTYGSFDDEDFWKFKIKSTFFLTSTKISTLSKFKFILFIFYSSVFRKGKLELFLKLLPF